MQHFKTLSAYLEYLELPRPEHPMISVFTAMGDGFFTLSKRELATHHQRLLHH